jgi:hypothetical protein
MIRRFANWADLSLSLAACGASLKRSYPIAPAYAPGGRTRRSASRGLAIRRTTLSRRTGRLPTNWRVTGGSATIAPREWTAFDNGDPMR